ncbi:MAG: hypothetical protein M5U19_08060 [Microthrixaceae bacterium]|nr:hypothetical protein [Microthrixaceae bacterium]
MAALAAARTRFIDTDDALIGVLRVAIDAVGPEPTGERARLLAYLAAELTYADGPTDRRELALEAVEIARALHDPRILVDVGTKCDLRSTTIVERRITGTSAKRSQGSPTSSGSQIWSFELTLVPAGPPCVRGIATPTNGIADA